MTDTPLVVCFMTYQRRLRLAVPIGLTAVLAGCRDPSASTPDVPPPPAVIAPRFPQPPPLPPEERTTRRLPLDSKHCGANDTTYIDHTITEVLARCLVTGQTTRVVLTVVSRATDPADYLHAISQRFCGNVVDAKGPEGWKVAVQRERGLGGLAAQVTWDAPPSARPDQPTARRMSDFSVTLHGEWGTGLGHYVAFTSGGPFAASPHDCPYRDR
jgi:hypothetical protein